MTSNQTVLAPQVTLEDPLALLPRSSIAEHKRGQVIYHQDQPSTSIHLVIDGRVKVSRLANDGRQTVVDIYQTDEFFGESALLGLPRGVEQATAMENTRLMSWTAAEIEEIVLKRPMLAIALLQILAQRALEYGHRIQSLSVETTSRRLARTLLRLSARLGVPEPDGSYRIVSITQELLAQYVGTSREVVTHYMNKFRKQGYLRYSRKGIILFPDAFKEMAVSGGAVDVGTANGSPT